MPLQKRKEKILLPKTNFHLNRFLYIGILCSLHAVINASRTTYKEKVPTTTQSAELKKNELQVCIDAGKVCLSPGCIHAASNMLKRMDTKVNPCDDFYKFRYGFKCLFFGGRGSKISKG